MRPRGPWAGLPTRPRGVPARAPSPPCRPASHPGLGKAAQSHLQPPIRTTRRAPSCRRQRGGCPTRGLRRHPRTQEPLIPLGGGWGRGAQTQDQGRAVSHAARCLGRWHGCHPSPSLPDKDTCREESALSTRRRQLPKRPQTPSPPGSASFRESRTPASPAQEPGGAGPAQVGAFWGADLPQVPTPPPHPPRACGHSWCLLPGEELGRGAHRTDARQCLPF